MRSNANFHHLRLSTRLLADEIAARQERSIVVRTKLAHLPVCKTLDSFDFDAQPSLDRRIVKELQTLAFIERAENVALLRAERRSGKTHLTLGIGMKALQAGVRVYFLTAQDLLDPNPRCAARGRSRSQTSSSQHRAVAAHRRTWIRQASTRAPLPGSSNFMCQRYEHRATLITSNKPFVDWGDLLG